MDKLELLQDLLAEVDVKLLYRDREELDAFSRKLRMYIPNILGSEAGKKHLEDLKNIHFYPFNLAWSPETKGIHELEWECGRNAMKNLIQTMIDEIKIFNPVSRKVTSPNTANNSLPKITLDTNCIINLIDYKTETATSTNVLSELVRYGLSGKVDIAITTRVEADLENDNDINRREEMMKKISLFPVIGTVFRLDKSKLSGADILSGDNLSRLSDELQKIIFPGISKTSKTYINKINDIDHLIGHSINQRDIFVTDDREILKKKDVLKMSPGIFVMSPVDCLKYLEDNPSSKKSFKEYGPNSYGATVIQIGGEGSRTITKTAWSTEGDQGYLDADECVFTHFGRGGYFMNVFCADGYKIVSCESETTSFIQKEDTCCGISVDKLKNSITIICERVN